MTWNDRQRQMLAAMGLRVWSPAASEAGSPPPDGARAAAAEPPPAVESASVSAPPPALVAAAAPVPAALPATVEAAAPVTVAAAAQPATDHAPPPCATMDWPALRAAVAGCRACSLHETRRQTVFGVGHPAAHWMIVGEAPGEQEDLAGEPFVGPAGQLLDQMLRALGLSRAEEGEAAQRVFIANTLKCRPPRNRNPEPEEMARCAPFLQRQIALVQPRIILAMGRFAVKSLLKSDEPIGRLRGRVHRIEGVPAIVTYHPAYLLRNLPDKAKAWDDLCLAAATLASA